MTLAFLACGFSVGVAALLAVGLATVYRDMALPLQSRVAGYGMLVALACTQLLHARFLDNSAPGNAAPELLSRSYAFTLFMQALGFYYLLLGVLRPQQQAWRFFEWMAVPVACACAALLPLGAVVPAALLFGAGATAHLGLLVFKLRAQRRWFVLEVRMLALFAVLAVFIAAASLAAPGVGWHSFAVLYATLIGILFFLILYVLLRFPDITSKAEEAVAATYAVSTLASIDCEKQVAQIKRLFEAEHIFEDENLSLLKLADMLALSSHQLSELINTQFGMGFSRLVRHYRVEAAKTMLINEPRASVLSVGLSVGFTSQSNFYVAFKEFTGIVPGQFRKQTAGSTPISTPISTPSTAPAPPN
jgi:AraC-like DNA-binding protein